MKEIDLSALDDLEGGFLLSPVGARSVAQNSFETNSFRIKEDGRDRERLCLITRKDKMGKIAC